jgi:hypothetical protein
MKEYDKNPDGKDKLRSDLMGVLGDKLYVFSKNLLVKHIIHHLGYEIVLKGKTNRTELLDQSRIVFKDFKNHFGIFENDPYIENKKLEELQLFLHHILNIIKVPGEEYLRIKKLAQIDILKRKNSIQSYKKDEIIQNYLKKQKVQGTQTHHMMIEFYNRNVREEKEIRNYLAIELKERLKILCSSYYNINNWEEVWFVERPYLSNIKTSEKYFDHTKIDKVSHKIKEVPLSLKKTVSELYESDRAKFYRKIQQYYGAKKVIHYINYYVDFFPPLTDHRKEVFQQLITFFKKRQWFGFYALAISQFEGLSDDILKYIGYTKQTSSLTQKVDALRNYFGNVLSSLDYYRFVLPDERNQFMHTGKITGDVKLKCYDLLYDLADLMEILANLESPVMRVANIVRKVELIEFPGAREIDSFFDLLDETKKIGQFKQIKDQLKTFREQLVMVHDIDSLIVEIEQTLDRTIIRMTNTIFLYSNDALRLSEWSAERIDADSQKTINTFAGLFYAYPDVLKEVNMYGNFLKRVIYYLSNLSRKQKQRLISMRKKYEKEFEQVSKIWTLLENNNGAS